MRGYSIGSNTIDVIKKNSVPLILIFLLLLPSCSIKWTEAVTYGKIEQKDYREIIDFEIKNGLIILPVQIQGIDYRFLFDSGAPFSISEELQNAFEFKVISKGHIIDSDANRKKVNYVQVDTIRIGNLVFTEQTAFEADFKSNPILECLAIDGIVGSNMMRHTNWTMDQSNKRMIVSDKPYEKDQYESIRIPFKTDYQYNILLELGIGSSTVKNLMVDYGSNGSISLPKDVFATLKERNDIGETYFERGTKQSGIIGKSVPLEREITTLDSVLIGIRSIHGVELKTGSRGLIGNKVLSRFLVTIDWDNRELLLTQNDAHSDRKRFGFTLGYSEDRGAYIQSVVENSRAAIEGILPGMHVLKMDTLDFSNKHGFCDYVALMDNHPDQIKLELMDLNGETKELIIENF